MEIVECFNCHKEVGSDGVYRDQDRISINEPVKKRIYHVCPDCNKTTVIIYEPCGLLKNSYGCSKPHKSLKSMLRKKSIRKVRADCLYYDLCVSPLKKERKNNENTAYSNISNQ